MTVGPRGQQSESDTRSATSKAKPMLVPFLKHEAIVVPCRRGPGDPFADPILHPIPVQHEEVPREGIAGFRVELEQLVVEAEHRKVLCLLDLRHLLLGCPLGNQRRAAPCGGIDPKGMVDEPVIAEVRPTSAGARSSCQLAACGRFPA